MKISRLISSAFALLISVQAANALIYASSDKVVDFIGIKSLGFLAGIGFLALAGITILFLFWMFMLIHCLKRDFKRDGDKIAWVIVIIFLQIFGALIYYFVIRIKDKEKAAVKSLKKR